jgi:hypothetical protein
MLNPYRSNHIIDTNKFCQYTKGKRDQPIPILLLIDELNIKNK